MRKMHVAALAVILGLVAGACGGDKTPTPTAKQSFAAGTTMDTIAKSGKLRVGVKFDVPQFGLLNPATNKPEGFDIDMANAIAAALGVPAEFTEAVSANRIPFLDQDKVDIVFSTMTITETRKKQIDFSVVYYVAGQSFLVKKTKPLGTATSGKKVCSVKGSTSEKNVKAYRPGFTVVLQDGYAQCFTLLQNGQADAVTTDDVILLGYLKKDPSQFQLEGGTWSKEPYGAGIKKGRTDFVDFVNNIIKNMKTDGRWAAIYKKWVTPITGAEGQPPADDVAAEAPK
jgi:ABC-type amino acid transport substrate-binding protein